MLFYYCYKGRYKKIIKHYEDKKEHNIQIHPVIVIIFYFVVSVILFFLAALFKNKDWIFAQ
jgi:preprotein translocase subunit Sec61beta